MKRSAGLTLYDAIVVVAVAALASAMLVPALNRAQEESRRKSCNNNISQIVKACITYQEPNGDFFPSHWDGNSLLGEELRGEPLGKNDGRTVKQALRAGDGFNNPMQSLALLYPTYIRRLGAFGCPSTDDTPKIIIRWTKKLARHNAFGKPATDPQTGKVIQGFVDAIEYGGKNMMDPADASHLAAGSKYKCSYLYDPLSHFRDIGPSQAMLADADGFSWRKPDGTPPEYPKSWTRKPRKPNHADGQNVMYFDGHVKWVETNHASDEPEDNIYTPELQTRPVPDDGTLKWLTVENMRTRPDLDAWVWDESNICR